MVEGDAAAGGEHPDGTGLGDVVCWAAPAGTVVVVAVVVVGASTLATVDRSECRRRRSGEQFVGGSEVADRTAVGRIEDADIGGDGGRAGEEDAGDGGCGHQ